MSVTSYWLLVICKQLQHQLPIANYQSPNCIPTISSVAIL